MVDLETRIDSAILSRLRFPFLIGRRTWNPFNLIYPHNDSNAHLLKAPDRLHN